MKRIYLGGKHGSIVGRYALVDDDDEARVKQFNWYAKKNGHTFYARRKALKDDKEKNNILMHRFLLDAPPGSMVDHRDTAGLNNQKTNLVFSTSSENQLNRRNLQTNNTSGISGISWNKIAQKWMAEYYYKGVRYYLGYFAHLEDAGMAIINFEIPKK